jgi:type II secretory pathway component PulK
VNVNTAPAEVLASLSDQMTLQAAEALVAWRLRPGADGRPEGIKKLEDLKTVPGLSGPVYDSISEALTVKSGLFEIRARSTVGNIQKSWVYVVSRAAGAEGKEGAVKLLSQQRLNDFLTVRPPGQEQE